MRPVWIALGTFFAVVVLAVLFFAARIYFGPKPVDTAAAEPPPQITLIDVSHTYDSGVSTISGDILLPTACTPITASTTIGPDGNIRVDITSQQGSGVCLALPAPSSFDASIGSTATASVSVYVNGALATTTP